MKSQLLASFCIASLTLSPIQLLTGKEILLVNFTLLSLYVFIFITITFLVISSTYDNLAFSYIFFFSFYYLFYLPYPLYMTMIFYFFNEIFLLRIKSNNFMVYVFICQQYIKSRTLLTHCLGKCWGVNLQKMVCVVHLFNLNMK